jgi:hypothetical protein
MEEVSANVGVGMCLITEKDMLDLTEIDRLDCFNRIQKEASLTLGTWSTESNFSLIHSICTLPTAFEIP